MGLLNALVTNKTDQNNYMKRVRMRFKQFCTLPRCLPNKLVRSLLGDLHDTATTMATRSLEHLTEDGFYRGVGPTVSNKSEIGYFKHVPSIILGLFDVCYRHACTEHNVVLNGRDLEKHGFRIDWERLMLNYQVKKRRCDVNREIIALTNRVGKLGKRFSSKATLAEQPSDTEEEINNEE